MGNSFNLGEISFARECVRLNQNDIQTALDRHARRQNGVPSLFGWIQTESEYRKTGVVGTFHVDRNGEKFLIETNDGKTFVCPLRL